MQGKRLKKITDSSRLLATVTVWVLSAGIIAAAAVPAAADEMGRSQDDIDIEEFLQSAEILGSEEVGEGITNPLRLTLRKDRVERRAIFKSVDETIDQISRTSGLEPKFTDQYAYEVAAYRIDRLIGIGLVPVTVLRTVGEEEGSVSML
jgi:hypothetical protein